MHLITLNTDFTRVATALERIASVAERMAGVRPQQIGKERLSSPDDLSVMTDAKAAAIEAEDLRRRLAGLPPEEFDAFQKEWDRVRGT